LDGSDGIYIIMPIVALIGVAILVVLPFVGDKKPVDSGSGGSHGLGHRAQGQVPGHSAATSSDAIGPSADGQWLSG
jgi:hypothetical protein